MDGQALTQHAYKLLARREHSRWELHHKLVQKFPESRLINEVLDNLEATNKQSDLRFVETAFNEYINKGFGPLKISHMLRQKGIASELIDSHCAKPDWYQLAERSRAKKFGAPLPAENKQKIAQFRFLSQRGFRETDIRKLLNVDESDFSA